MLWWAAQNLFVASLMAAGAWALCRFSRIGPTARHAVWLVVLIKLLTPPLVVWPWAVPNPLAKSQPSEDPAVAITTRPRSESAIQGETAPSAVAHNAWTSAAVNHNTGATRLTTVASPGPARALPTPRRPGERDRVETVWAALAIAWLFGSITYALVQTVRIRRMVFMARRGRNADQLLIHRMGQMAHRVGMRPIRARLVDELDSPLVFSAIRPTLLWPGRLPPSIAESSIDGLIVHELAHVRRGDHWVGWLELLAGVAWWWNPLFWYVRHQLRENAELACDAWVVGTLPSGRRAYAEALLSVCECISSKRFPAPAPALGIRTGGREFLERRLKMILRDRVPLRLSRLGLAMIGLVATSTLPAWSQKSTTPTRNSETGYSTISLGIDATFGVSADSLPQEAEQLIAQYEQRKADAQREMEQRMSGARAELTRQLKELQDRYTKAGDLDQAVAIRDRLRALETGGTAISGLSGWTTTTIASPEQPGNLTMFRNHVGKTLTYHVVGTTGGTVWGNDVYTDDSTLAAAAVHAGVLRPGEAGEVHVMILPGRAHYDGVRQNGIESHPYGEWPGSYRFVGNSTPGILPNKTPDVPRVRKDPGTLEDLRDRIDQTFTFDVTGATDGPVWGGPDNVFTVDSNLATAAVHAGALRPGERGVITVKILPDRGSYEGTTRNGVESQSWGAWHGSYRISASAAHLQLDQPTGSGRN